MTITPGSTQAFGALRDLEGRASSGNDFRSAKKALRGLAKAGFRVAFVEMGEDAFMVVFSDGSGFFGDTDDGKFTAWPIDAATEAGGIDLDHLLADIPLASSSLDFSGAEIQELASPAELPEDLREFLDECLDTHPEPPVVLFHLLRKSHQDISWASDARQKETMGFITDFLSVFCPAGCSFRVYSDVRNGRLKAEAERQARQYSLMQQYAHLAGPTMEFSYNGRAHCEIMWADNTSEVDLPGINALLAWFSNTVFERLGIPSGWDLDYNDGPSSAMSGYTTYSDALDLELSPTSHHQQLSSCARVRDFLDREGLRETFLERLHEAGVKAFRENFR